MPKLLRARAPQDATEESKIHKLANSRHAPADWINRAKMIVGSWEGLRTTQIASELRCHPQTVRERIHRYNTEGFDGLGDRRGCGRKARLTETELSKIISLVGKDPPGKLVRYDGLPLEAREESKSAHWTLDSLTEAARENGIRIGRSQVRRILLREGVRWRRTRPWAESEDPQFVPKEPGSLSYTPTHHRTPR